MSGIDAAERRERSHWHDLAGAALLLAVAMGIGRFAFTPILPDMTAAGVLDTGSAGLVAAANFVGYLVGALTTGPVERRFGAGPVLALSVALTAILSLAMGWPQAPLAWWLAVRFLAGVASGWLLVTISAMLFERLAERDVSHLAGLAFGGVGIGMMLSAIYVREAGQGWIVQGFIGQGWAAEWIGMGVLAAILSLPGLLLLGRVKPFPPRVPHPQGDAHETARTGFRLLAAAYFLEGLGYIVTGTFMVAVFRATPALSVYADNIWLIAGAAAVPSCLVWTLLAARVGFARALTAALLLQSVGIVLPVVTGNGIAAIASAVLFGGTFMGIATLAVGFGRQLAPHDAARAIGTLTALFGVGQIIGPLAGSWLAQMSGGFAWPLVTASGAVALAALLLLPLCEFCYMQNREGGGL